MSQQVIRVEPIDRVMSITWMLGKRCNYDCMYCPASLHDTTSKHWTLSELKTAWNSILEKTQHLDLRYKLSFSGGEVTSSKHLLPFLIWLRETHGGRIFQILLTTNGSATLKYYKKLFDVVDNVSFSTHSEFFDERKFFATVTALKESLPADKFIHVNIMDEYWNKDRIPKYTKILTDHQISHSVNIIDYSKGTRTVPLVNGKLNLDN